MRAYGSFITGANAVVIGLSVAVFVGGVAMDEPRLVAGAIVQICISSLLCWVGKALQDGKKAAVRAVTALAVLELLVGLLLAGVAKEGGSIIAAVVIIGVSIVLGPPIIVAFRDSEKFD